MNSAPKLIPMRPAYGRALVALGAANPDVVVLSADVSNSDFSFLFQEAYPDRFYNVGIAEQALVDVAAGLAYAGKIPFANTFAFLFATRALEMVRTHLCYGGANVKLMAAYAGISDSFDGPTHHSVCDIAIMRSLPNMTIVVPSDTAIMEALLPQIADWAGPVYCRLNRNEVPLLHDTARGEARIGRAISVRPGTDVTIIAAGLMVGRSLEAATMLQSQGISAAVLDMHTIKPLDVEAVMGSARATGALVTAEEHSVIGGLGGAVAEVVGAEMPVPVVRVGLPDCFAESGPYGAILDRYGMSVQDIIEAARRSIAGKRWNLR